MKTKLDKKKNDRTPLYFDNKKREKRKKKEKKPIRAQQ
jgi:hypothetical protein